MDDTTIEKSILPLIESQFPSFYQEEGPLFILFIEEYFKWLETNYLNLNLANTNNFNIGDTLTQGTSTGVLEAKTGNTVLVRVTSSNNDFKCTEKCSITIPLTSTSGGNTLILSTVSNSPNYYIRRLLETNDVDRSAQKFLTHYKEKYLKNINFDTSINKRRFVKASSELYRSKGSSISIDLLFKLLYNTDAQVYTPADNILMPSSGNWITPRYIEVTRTSRNPSYLNRQITGTTSGATAFVEQIITRNIKGRLIDVFYLTSLTNDFVVGESITYDKNQIDAPTIIGSLNDITITFAGSEFIAGDAVQLLSNSGVEGVGYVSALDTTVGAVGFTLADGGWGYSNGLQAIISSRVLTVANATSTFEDFETVSQPMTEYLLINSTGNIEEEDSVSNVTETGNSFVVFSSVEGANTTIIVNNLSGNLNSYPGSGPNYEKMIRSSNKQWLIINTTPNFITGEIVKQQNTTSANVTSGVLRETELVSILRINTHTSGNIKPGNYIVQNNTGATGYVKAIPWTDYFDFSNVSYIAISNTNGIFSNTDFILAYSNSTNTSVLGNNTPNNAQLGFILKLDSITGQRWYSGNTIVGNTSAQTATTIFVADVGGYVNTSANATATGNVLASNTTAIGLVNTVNTFYSGTKTLLTGLNSLCNAVINATSTGSGANVRVGSITNEEQIRVNTDFLGGNNFYSHKYANIFLSGANSNTSQGIANVIIHSGGSGYDNSHVIVFNGGNSSGGTQAGNASLVTDVSGTITSVTLSANVGTYFISTPNVEIRDSSNNLISVANTANITPIFALGFPKLPTGTIDTPLLSLLEFTTSNIGTIATFTEINSGQNYNIKPFVRFLNKPVAAFNIGDYELNVLNTSNTGYVVGEIITQTINTAAIQIISNNITGNTNYEFGELVYSTDGINQVAYAIVENPVISGANLNTVVLDANGTFQNTITVSLLTVDNNTNFNNGDLIAQNTANGVLVNSNSTTLVVKNVSGSFAANATSVTSNSGGSATISIANNSYNIYTLKGSTSNCSSKIISANAITYSPLAYAKVREYNFANGYLRATPYSFFNRFVAGSGSLIGTSSLANSTILFVGYTNPVMGDNANTLTDVSSNTGVASIKVTDSGLGYLDSEFVNIKFDDRAATGRAVIGGVGRGTSGYTARKGFLSDYDRIHDGEYYQFFSYEVQSALPLAKYSDMLREVLHIAGTKLFGKYKSTSVLNIDTSVSNSSITIS